MRTALTRTSTAMALIVLTGCGGDSETREKIGAYQSCERAVETQLKAPATADFSGYTNSEVAGPSESVYTVHGYVDSENSFGANVRSDWECQVRSTGDNWDLVNLDVS